jgi:hypothetical protein
MGCRLIKEITKIFHKNMKQIRIYYESLEQAENYIKPIIDQVLDTKTVDIVLVKRPKSAKDLNDGSLAAIQTMTTPDALITGITNDTEYPLVLIEFTEDVTTEDHELQRTYGAMLKQDKSYQTYRERVNAATGANDLLEAWKGRRDSNLNKLRYCVRDNYVAAKIKRFSHAMDPDRGILTFISFLFSETNQVFGVYALVRPRGNELMQQYLTTLDELRDKLATVLEMDKGGIPDWLIDELTQTAAKAKSLNETIDFSACLGKA